MQPMIKLIDDYSAKGIALIGETFPIRKELKELNGSFNPRLKYEGLTVAGWVFSKKKIEAIRDLVKKHSNPTTEAPEPVIMVRDLLPTVTEYTLFLNKAVERFNISIDEARNKYGLFTKNQWEKLFEFERDEKPKVEPVKQVDKSNLLATFRKKAGKKYAEKYIELCNEANICIFHALENFMMRKKLQQFKEAYKFIKTKNAKKEYHKPVFKDSPFKGRLTVKKGESNNVIETTFKNSEALEKLMKQLSKEAEEQRIFISFKFEKID